MLPLVQHDVYESVVVLDSRNFTEWLKQIASMKRFIRRIELRCIWHQTHMCPALHLLKQMTSLQVIRISPQSQRMNKMDPWKMALACKPFMKEMIRARIGEEHIEEVLKTIRIMLPSINLNAGINKAISESFKFAFTTELRKLVQQERYSSKSCPATKSAWEDLGEDIRMELHGRVSLIIATWRSVSRLNLRIEEAVAAKRLAALDGQSATEMRASGDGSGSHLPPSQSHLTGR